MKILSSSLFRAICALLTGALLLAYGEQMVTWITIAIGVMFAVSGIISVVTYLSLKRQANGPIVYDANGNQLTGIKPAFPIVGIGSLLLGIILALMPNTFINSLMFILAALLILGAINQMSNLVVMNRVAHIGFFYWIVPVVIFIVGMAMLLKPTVFASFPLLVLGWCMLLYGVAEIIDAVKIHICKKQLDSKNDKSQNN